MDASIVSKTSPLMSITIALSSTDAITANRIVETNFLDFLSFDCGDNDEMTDSFFANLGVFGDATVRDTKTCGCPPRVVALSRWWFPNCFAPNIKFKTRIFILINYVYVFNDIKKKYIYKLLYTIKP